MITVVLDTNVVVSGTFWTGASYQILKLVNENKIKIIVSLPILEEYEKIIYSEEILEKTDAYQQAKVNLLQKLLTMAKIVNPKETLFIVKNDPDDNKFIEAAVEGKVDYIISNDKKHLLVLKKFRDIKILSPEEFLKIIS
ncbi:putative toxin-antitoxin system toxin component, PIN family [Candidatus Woesearchaeota archaeon]|nr:putative toxin-antitoxin system toxin component, PIN family [Candidatus Woesearchaeota archaeon]